MSSIDNVDGFPGWTHVHNASDFDPTQLKLGTEHEIKLGADIRMANYLAMEALSRDPWHYADIAEAKPGRKLDKILTTTGYIFKSVERAPSTVVTADAFVNVIDMIEREAPNVSEAKFNNLVEELSDGISDKKISLANIGNVFAKYKIRASRKLQKDVFNYLSKV